MSNKLVLISPEATEAINLEVQRLPSPGGLVGVFDPITGSVIVFGVDKRLGTPVLRGWSVSGPCSENEAKELLRTEVGEVGKDGWARRLH